MFKRMIVLTVATVLMALPLQAQDWSIDKAHSSIGFAVKHLVISTTKGYFRDYDGNIKFDGKNLENASADLTIQVASIDTDNEDRDKHLRSDDFFDVGTYPVIQFESKKVVSGEGNNFRIVGDLTIKDVTREVTLDGEFHGVINDPWGNTRAGFSAATTIDRQDFNVKWSNKLQDGSLVVSDDVKIMLEIELIQNESAK